jgi:hypothetical protein
VTDLPDGAYERVVTRGLERQLLRHDHDLVQRVDLDPADSHVVLSRHISALTHRALRAVPGQGAGDIASTTAIDALSSCDQPAQEPDLTAVLGRAINAADEATRRRIREEPELAGMETSMVAILRSGNAAILANPGHT